MSPRNDVLTDDAEEITRFLIANPGQWFLIAKGTMAKRNTIKATATRIRRGKLTAFAKAAAENSGSWEVSTTAARHRPHPVADVEMTARWVPLSESAAPEAEPE